MAELHVKVHQTKLWTVLEWILFIIFSAIIPTTGYRVRDGVVKVDLEEQKRLLNDARQTCYHKLMTDPFPDNDTYCLRTWDNISCWPDTPPGVTIRQTCASYVNNFNISAYATKTCTENGTWFYNPEYNQTWTNYTNCVAHVNKTYNYPHAEHMGHIMMMYSIGYGLSLVSLTLALIIMIYFKKLHCPRNTVHINLFLSFMLRAGLSFLKENLLVQGVGLKKDIIFQDSRIIFKDGIHWECKLLMVLFNYAMVANYMWIFVEGLYLHMLIFVSVFSERSRVHWYCVLGWCAPIVIVVPWALVRAFLENEVCWNTHPTAGYLWIIKGPVSLTIIINFVFFINICRVLFTKLKATNTHETRKYRYRKLAKSTLVLIPLFGVYYMVFLGFVNEQKNENLELAKLYFEMFFNSFQGFLVAVLFCFMNGEVRGEFRKKYRRFQLRRGSYVGGASLHHSNWTTTNTYVGSYPKNGRAGGMTNIDLSEKEVSDQPANGNVCNNHTEPNSENPESNEEGYVVLKNVICENHNGDMSENVHAESHVTKADINKSHPTDEKKEECRKLVRERDSPTTSARKDSGYEEYAPMIQEINK